MKITHLRTNGKKLEQQDRENLSSLLIHRLAVAGYDTDGYGLMHIGLHMKCFTINTALLGYNKRMSRYSDTLVGFKKTNLPTWDERVNFNDIINDFFDEHELTAKIVSGTFLVRCHREGAQTEREWLRTHNPWDTGEEVSKLTAADEAEAKEIRRAHRREKRNTKALRDQYTILSATPGLRLVK